MLHVLTLSVPARRSSVLIAMAKGYPDRVRELVDKEMSLDTARRGKVMTLLGECESAGDGDREAVRSALRRELFWHRNYDEKRPPAELDALLAPLEEHMTGSSRTI